MTYLSFLPAIIAAIVFIAAGLFAGRVEPEKRARIVAFCAGMIFAQVLTTLIQAAIR
jgi:hypothetical protein